MRLINTYDARITDYTSRRTPAYAILSHRWTSEEVSFDRLQSGISMKAMRSGKLRGFMQQAKRDGLKFGWLDTCCINKDSSAELTEAINSMYQWYQNARLCYVYLVDVDREHWQDLFPRSQWFKRGWTLQELLAPSNIHFYDCRWRFLGSRAALADEISRITGIPCIALRNGSLQQFSVAQKMSWAAHRVTTRLEDSAYCLMGLFDVNMPLLYGEGHRAFLRLQEEIIKSSDDHSIFAWSMGRKKVSGLLAPSASCFAGAMNTVSLSPGKSSQPFSMTNRGLSIHLEITPWSANTYLAYLDCVQEPKPNHQVKVGIFLRRLSEPDQYARFNFSRKGLWNPRSEKDHFRKRPTKTRMLFVRQNIDLQREETCLADYWYGFKLSDSLLQSVASSKLYHPSYGYITVLQPGDWGCAIAIDISPATDGLVKLALGFDFDFNPVCLLQGSTANGELNIQHADIFDWSSTAPDDIEWDEIIEGDRAHFRGNHNGLWFLRGDRIRGLDVLVSAGLNDRGSLVTLGQKRHRSKLVWELDIDNLVGPFRNHHHQALRSAFGDRHGFQASYGLDMTDESLTEGDSILRAMYDPAQ